MEEGQVDDHEREGEESKRREGTRGVGGHDNDGDKEGEWCC